MDFLCIWLVLNDNSVELVLVGLVSHVPDRVEVWLDVGQPEGSPHGQGQGEGEDEEGDWPLDYVGRDPLLEYEPARPGSGPGGRTPVWSGRDLPGFPLLVQHQAGHEESGGEQEEEDDSDSTEVAKPS